MPPTDAPMQSPAPSPAPAPQPQSKLPLYLWIAAIAIVFAVGLLVYSLKTSRANSDYICTKVVELSGNCANGSWGGWTQTSQTTDANNITTTTYQRTYTGTRETSKTLTYLNLRTACQAGYAQTGGGSQNGASGFHGGSVTTTQSACQITQTQTVVKTSGPTGGNSKWTITSTQTDLAQASTTQRSVGSLEELNANDTSAGSGGSGASLGEASGEIAVKPELVRAGQTTTVAWSASGADSCAVASDGGDAWSGLAGTQVSKPIMRKTTFTLTCSVGGAELTSTATVNVTPTYQEQ